MLLEELYLVSESFITVVVWAHITFCALILNFPYILGDSAYVTILKSKFFHTCVRLFVCFHEKGAISLEKVVMFCFS